MINEKKQINFVSSDNKNIDVVARKKKRAKLVVGIFVFYIFAFSAILNFLLGSFLFAVFIKTHQGFLLSASLLCFFNILICYMQAIESYYTHAGDRKKNLWLELNYDESDD